MHSCFYTPTPLPPFNSMSHTCNWISSAKYRDSLVVQLFKVRGEHGCSSVDIDGKKTTYYHKSK
jgi:hypothetical protein